MDLGTMGRKVRGKQYRTKAEFVADLNLIWDNCLNYNANPVGPFRTDNRRTRLTAVTVAPIAAMRQLFAQADCDSRRDDTRSI
jgi:transcriptional activator SPT7